MHPKTHRATYILARGLSHERGESGRAIGRVQGFSLVAFKVQVYDLSCSAVYDKTIKRCKNRGPESAVKQAVLDSTIVVLARFRPPASAPQRIECRSV